MDEEGGQASLAWPYLLGLDVRCMDVPATDPVMVIELPARDTDLV